MSGNLASKTCISPQRWWNHRRAGFILIDTKNYASISAIFKGSNIDQLKAYLTAISSMNKLKIIQANRSSFGANTALTTLKKNLQKVYNDNFDDFFQIFWTNSNLRSSLFPNISLESVAKIKFRTDVNIQISDTNSNAYFDFVNLHDL